MLGPGDPPRRLHVAEPQHQAPGLHRAGRERVDPDILPSVIDRHGLGELDHRALSGAIDGAATLALPMPALVFS